MPGFLLHVGATVHVRARRPGPADVAEPARAAVGGQPVGDAARTRTSSPAARSCRRPPGPCVTAQWVVGAVARPRRRRTASCSRTARRSARRPARRSTVVVTQVRVKGDADCRSTIRSTSTAAAGPRATDDRRPHPRPDRAGAVHRAGRARQPADASGRPAAAGVRAQQRRARHRHAVPRPGRPAAVARRPDRGRATSTSERGLDAARDRPVPVRAGQQPQTARSSRGRCDVAVQYAATTQDQRLESASDGGTLNGIDFLEVLDHDAPTGIPPSADAARATACDPLPDAFTKANVRIEGGVRHGPDGSTRPGRVGVQGDADPRPLRRRSDDARRDRTFSDAAGAGATAGRPDEPAATSPRYRLRARRLGDRRRARRRVRPAAVRGRRSRSRSTARATSTAGHERRCPPALLPAPQIDYLAKDYASFRRLMLDRLAVVMPDWSERNPADLGVALVELLAYVGDQLELPPGRGRDRGVPRHGAPARLGAPPRPPGRLLDARRLQRPRLGLRRGRHGCRRDGRCSRPAPRSSVADRVTAPPVPPSQAREALVVRARWSSRRSIPSSAAGAHNAIEFYTWGDLACCLPAGATRATLAGRRRRSGCAPATCSSSRRSSGRRRIRPSTPTRRTARPCAWIGPRRRRGPIRSTDTRCSRSRWHAEDALPFPLCLWQFATAAASRRRERRPRQRRPRRPRADDPAPGRLAGRRPARRTPCRYRPALPTGRADVRGALTTTTARGASLPPRPRPSRSARRGARRSACADDRRDLVARSATCSPATVRARVRRRDGDRTGGVPAFRRRRAAVDGPSPGTHVPRRRTAWAAARAGNVGARRARPSGRRDLDGIVVRSAIPLPAAGGADPEPIEQVRQYAPQAFRTQERAVTEADYADGGRASSRRAARRGDAALDGQLVHGVRRDRPARRLRRRRRLRAEHARRSSSRSGWPATTSRSTRPRFVAARHRAHRLRRSRTTSGRRQGRRCSTRSARARLPERHAAASSTPTTSRSASPCT